METRINVNRKKVFLLSTLAIVFMLSMNFNIFNTATQTGLIEDNQDVTIDSLKTSLPEDYLTGQGVSLPVEGSSNASKQNQHVTSWTGGYQTANIPFATPETFWSGATVNYEKVRVNVYDIKKINDRQPLDFEEVSYSSWGGTHSQVSKSMSTTSAPWSGDTAERFDFATKNTGAVGVSLGTPTSSQVQNTRRVQYNTGDEGGSESCGTKTYDDGNAPSTIAKYDYYYYENWAGSNDCREDDDDYANHADLTLDITAPQVGVWADLDWRLRALTDATDILSGQDGWYTRTGYNRQDYNIYIPFTISNEMYHSYQITLSGASYANFIDSDDGTHTQTGEIIVDLEVNTGSWVDATGGSTIYTQSSFSGSTQAISDSGNLIYTAVKNYGPGSYRLKINFDIDITSSRTHSGDMGSYHDDDLEVNTYVNNLALYYYEENQYVQNIQSEGVQTHTSDVGAYWYGVISAANYEQTYKSFKVTTANDANDQYDGFISNGGSSAQLTLGTNYIYKLEAWIPTGRDISFRMRQYPSGGYQVSSRLVVSGNNDWQTVEVAFTAETVGSYTVSNMIEGVQNNGGVDDVFSFWIKNLQLYEGDTTKIGYQSSNVAFGYEIDGSVMFSYECYVSSGLEGATGYTDISPAEDTLAYGSLYVEVYADGTLWQESSMSLKSLRDDGDRIIKYNNTFSAGIMDEAANLKIISYLKFDSKFCVAYDLSGAYALMHNIRIKCNTWRDLDSSLDINVRLTESGTPAGLPRDVDTAPTEISNHETNFDISDSDGFIFTTTTSNLQFTYDYYVFFSFTHILTTTYYAYANTFTRFCTMFNYDINELDLTGYTTDYYQSFFFALGIPKWAAWDLTYHDKDVRTYPLGYLDDTSLPGDPKIEFYTTVSAAQQNNYIYVDTSSQFSGLAETHPAKFSNAIITSQSYVDQTWRLNFTIPTVMSNVILSNKTNQGDIMANPASSFYAGTDTVNFYAEFTQTLDESGSVGVMFYEPDMDFVKASTPKALSGADEITFIGPTEGWEIGELVNNSNGYEAWVNYTAQNLGGLTGKFRVCLMTESFNVFHRSYYSIYLTHNIYDTRTNGLNSELIEIHINWTDANTGKNIKFASGKTLKLGDYQTQTHPPAKKPTTPDIYSMNQTTEGNYTIKFFPNFYDYETYKPAGIEGNDWHKINWGYHNFTAFLSKSGYDTIKISEDFSVIVDTWLKISSPSHDSDDRYGNPHFVSAAIMGEEFTISARLYENLTYGGQYDYIPISGGEDSFYENQVQINYSLWQIYEDWESTPALIPKNQWGQVINWTYCEGAQYNPINGSFVPDSQGIIYTATLKWFEMAYANNQPKYESGLYFIYNISSYVKTKYRFDLVGDQVNGWMFQPDLVTNETTKYGPGTPPVITPSHPDYPGQEEPVRVKLFSKEFGNATDIVVLNYGKDGHPFNLSTSIYDNATDQDPDNHADYYKIVQYFHNATPNTNPNFILETGPNGDDNDGTSNSFRMRILFNCTHTGLGEIKYWRSPPVGPLNQSNKFFGNEYTFAGDTHISLIGWNSSDISFKPDNSTLIWYTYNRSHSDNPSEVLTPKAAWAQTYVTPWLFFNSSEAGNHTVRIIAEKPGFINTEQVAYIEIKPQKTIIRHSNGVYKGKLYENYPLRTSNALIPPMGNVTYFDIDYMDFTNNATIGELFVPGATINVVADYYYGEYVIGKGNHWCYKDFNNGTYRIYFNNTNLNRQYPDGLVRFEIFKDTESLKFSNKPEYKKITFDVHLQPRKRILAIIPAAYRDVSFYSEHPRVLNHHLIYYSYELRDMDNKTGGVGRLIDFENNMYITESWSSALSIKMNNTNAPWVLTEDVDYNKTIKTSHPRYNFTYSTKAQYGAGNYTIVFKLQGLAKYQTANATTKIEIKKVAISPILTAYQNTTEYYPEISTISLTDSVWYRLQLLDLNYTKFFGTNYYQSFDNCYLDGNWSNPNYNNFNASAKTLNRDYRFDYSPGDTTANIYLDIRGTSANNSLYWHYLNITKKTNNPQGTFINYRIIHCNYSFRITNSSTTFDKSGANQIIYLDDFYKQTDVQLPTAANKYFPNGLNNSVIAWGQWMSISLTYKADKSTAQLSTGISGAAIQISVKNWTVAWPAFAPSITDRGEGVYHVVFQLNVPVTGNSEGAFVIKAFKKNYAPMTFEFNMSTRDRYTSRSLNLGQNVGRWNETTDRIQTEITWSFQLPVFVRYYDVDGSDYVVDAAVSCPYANQDENFTWSFTELENGIYAITIKTDNLTVNKAYYVGFYLQKSHYTTQLFIVNFTVIPVEYSVEIEILPGEDFNPAEVEELTIKISIFVNVTDSTGAMVRKQVNVDYFITGLEVLWEIRKDGVVVKSGSFEWNEAQKKFIAVISTKLGEDDTLKGVYQLIIIVRSDDPHFATYSSDAKDEVVKLAALGEIETLPVWFFPVLIAVIGAIAGLAGYTIRKAIYLSIPFVLRKIDETVKKIEKDKFPAVGVMTGREEFIINSVVQYLEDCEIEWERDDKFEVKKVGEGVAKEKLPPMNIEQLNAELAKITDLEAEEKTLFLEELKRLDREAQEEFLRSLGGEIKK